MLGSMAHDVSQRQRCFKGFLWGYMGSLLKVHCMFYERNRSPHRATGRLDMVQPSSSTPSPVKSPAATEERCTLPRMGSGTPSGWSPQPLARRAPSVLVGTEGIKTSLKGIFAHTHQCTMCKRRPCSMLIVQRCHEPPRRWTSDL